MIHASMMPMVILMLTGLSDSKLILENDMVKGLGDTLKTVEKMGVIYLVQSKNLTMHEQS